MPLQEEDERYPNGTEGYRIIEFIEHFCVDEFTRKPIKLAGFQKQILKDLFEYSDRKHPRTGQPLWKHRQALIMLPRKCGKSWLSAGIALYTLVARGEFSAQIFCCASSKEQAEMVFRPFRTMVEESEELSAICTINRRIIINNEYKSFFQMLSSDAKRQHGKNPLLTIVDETHAHLNSDLTDALTSGSIARPESMLIHVTTPAYGESHFLYGLFQHGLQTELDPNYDETFYFYWNHPPEGMDHTDPETWKWHPGVAEGFIDTTAFVSDSKKMHESEFRRLYLGEWTSAEASWLPHGAWSALEAVEPPTAGARLALGVDGAYAHDAIAVVGAELQDDGRVALHLLRLWERPHNAPEDWHHDLDALEHSIRKLCEEYKVYEIRCDPFKIERQLYKLADDGYPIITFNTSYGKQMTGALQAFHAGVMDKTILHDHNADFSRHMSNAMVEVTQDGYRLTKQRSKDKHDAAIAAVLAHEAAILHGQRPTWNYF